MKDLLPANFTENDVVFEKNADKKFVSLVNDLIKPSGGKVFIRNEQNEFEIYNEKQQI